MATQLMRRLLRLLDEPGASVCHSDDWPDAFIKDCCAAGLLSQADDAAHIECPFCYDHHALAVSTVWVGRKRTLLGTCPEAGVQSVAAELVKQYRPQEAGLRALIAGALGRRGVDAAGLAGDEPLGHLLHQGQDYTVMLARSTPDWKRVTKGNPRLIALTVEADRLDEVPPAVTVVALDRLITWNAKQGVCCTLTGLDDLLPTSLASTGGVELDGFQDPNVLIFRGQRHRLKHASPQVKKLLQRMAEADRTSIHQLVGKKRVWAGNWPGDRTSLGGRIRAAIAKVNIALMSASPSVPYEFTTDLRKSEIRREIRKHV